MKGKKKKNDLKAKESNRLEQDGEGKRNGCHRPKMGRIFFFLLEVSERHEMKSEVL